MKDEIELGVEFEDQPLSDAADAAHDCAFDGGERRIDGS
jgi:hypothetical protein